MGNSGDRRTDAATVTLTVPPGWTVGSVGQGGTYDGASRTVSWTLQDALDARKQEATKLQVTVEPTEAGLSAFTAGFSGTPSRSETLRVGVQG